MGKVKYGVPVPNSVMEEYYHNKQIGNDLWEKAVKEEIQTIIDNGMFKFPDPGESITKGYQDA
jgi:hypothetical protein